MESKKYSMDLAGRELTLEFGKYCEQAAGSVWVHLGDTVVMVNATMAPTPRPGVDFFPLAVDVEEKQYSVGKIPGGFIKREGRPTEKATLTCRLIDRPLRPLFNKGMRNDVQVVVTVLSVEQDVPPEIPAMIGSSIALAVSEIPWNGPTGAVVVGRVDGQYVINPDEEQRAKSDMHVYLAGTKDAIMMVEAGANEVSETAMLDAIMFGHEYIKKLVEFQDKIVAEIGKEKVEVPLNVTGDDVKKAVREFAYDKCVWVFDTFNRQERQAREAQVKQETIEALAEQFPEREAEIADALYYLNKEVMRKKIIEQGIRPDGRGVTEIRPIWCEVGVLPRVHGSAVFTRGQTQALTVTTLGSTSEGQVLDGLSSEDFKRYIHHYNMPPYATGEAGRLKSPGRREIGHGKLAWRAIHPMMPKDKDAFPYTIRVVSEILESNGSSSMATVCGTTMSLMAAGVPMAKPVAGIAMGLIKEDDGRVAILTDILGDEDHLGDMDFKVAGTKDGVTALQMDIKITSITKEIMKNALAQAHEGRIHILGEMAKTIAEPRPHVAEHAPRIIALKIPVDKIREVIGSGGKVIREITEKTNSKIDISDDGVIRIATVNSADGQAALDWIMGIVAEPEEGKIYKGVITKIMDFGAFVKFVGSTEGLVHISEVKNERIASVSDFYKEGDSIWVKCLGMDNRGKFKLSAKRVNQETGEDLENAK